MRIEVKLCVGGGIICNEKHCHFRSECANHRTAGMHREEGGFTPELHTENDMVFCLTKEQPCDPEFPDFPINGSSLGRGMLVKDDDGNLRVYSLFE